MRRAELLMCVSLALLGCAKEKSVQSNPGAASTVHCPATPKASGGPERAVVHAESDECKGIILIATCPKGLTPKPLSYVHVAFGDIDYIGRVDSILHATCER